MTGPSIRLYISIYASCIQLPGDFYKESKESELVILKVSIETVGYIGWGAQARETEEK